MSLKESKIILDCCRNHLGNSEIIVQMIKIAALYGVDYIKFQIYTSTKLNLNLYSEENRISYAKHELSDDQIKLIVNECLKHDIKPMFTLFTLDKLEFIKEIITVNNVAIKIASPDMMNYELIDNIIKQFWEDGNEMFISCGMHSLKEIHDTRKKYEYDDIKWLYCVSKYPTYIDDLNFDVMRTFDGFSDHTIGIEAAELAITNGLDYIEKHFTLSKNLPCKDNLVSITPDEVKKLTEYRRYINSIKLYKGRWV